jgi:hypothetical protein
MWHAWDKLYVHATFWLEYLKKDDLGVVWRIMLKKSEINTLEARGLNSYGSGDVLL